MDDNKEALKRQKQEARSQIKNLKSQQKENKKEIKRIKSENGKSGAGTGLVIVLVIFFLLLLLLLIKLDVGGFGSQVLAPAIGDVPYLNRILPAGSVSSDALSSSDVSEKAAGKKKKKEKKKKAAATTTEAATEAVTAAPATTAASATTEASGTSGSDSGGGSAASATTQMDPAMQVYVDTYEKMDADKAAAILEGMTGDYDLVARILINMDPQSRADILAAMSTENAEKIMKYMERAQ